MPAPLDFYFDFSSPYGYIGACLIEELARRHGRAVTWRPIMLGPIFKLTGGKPLVLIPLKGQYTRRDMVRSARFYGVSFNAPEQFPFSSHNASRAFYWLHDRNPGLAVGLAKAVFKAYFVDGRQVSQPEEVIAVAAELGIDSGELLQALGDQTVKERLKHENEQAASRGVFGSPFVIVDGEPFWGVDRFDQVERWLKTGGW